MPIRFNLKFDSTGIKFNYTSMRIRFLHFLWRLSAMCSTNTTEVDADISASSNITSLILPGLMPVGGTTTLSFSKWNVRFLDMDCGPVSFPNFMPSAEPLSRK